LDLRLYLHSGNLSIASALSSFYSFPFYDSNLHYLFLFLLTLLIVEAYIFINTLKFYRIYSRAVICKDIYIFFMKITIS